MTQMQMETQVRTEVLGRITKAPTFARTMDGGVPVCRFTVATEVGPASNPVVKDIFVVGNPSGRRDEPLAVACRRLAVGSLVYVPGVEYQTMRKVRGVRFPVSAIKAEDVRLRARA